MVILLNAKTQLTKGSTLGLLEIPPLKNGEERELNDFQWVAPSKEWKKWIDSAGRNWQAESEESDFLFLDNLREAIIMIEGSIEEKGFKISNKFSSIYKSIYKYVDPV